MTDNPKNKSIIIIGAGFAGMAAGIYAQLNGYKTIICEMHSQPGGLCTSWNRKGYTFDACIHWLVGSSPSSGMHDMWEELIRELINGIRICIPFDSPSKHDSLISKFAKQSKSVLNFALKGKKMQDWMKITCKDFAERFKDPLIRTAINEMWIPDFSIFFMLFTMAYLQNRNAGYPIGGSLPMLQSMPGLSNFHICGQWVEPGNQ
jgi:hypothetical protein